jgi:hypothetical protein
MKWHIKEWYVCIRFFTMGKTVSETFRMLKLACGEETICRI